MRDLASDIRMLGGLAKKAELLRLGHSERSVFNAVTSKSIVRVRKGWYSPPELDVPLLQAARVGGRLTCVSAARQWGLWVLDAGETIHVDVAGNASRLRTAHDHRRRLSANPADSVLVHWRKHKAASGTRLMVNVVDAINEIFRCRGAEAGFATLESALHQRVISPTDRSTLHRILTSSCRSVAAMASPLSESGTESLLALRLRALGVHFRQQVTIDGVGRVDFVLGQRLVIEVDSREHHSDPYRDRRRDAILSSRGYRVLRFMYSQIVYEWTSVEQAILAALGRGDHHHA